MFAIGTIVSTVVGNVRFDKLDIAPWLGTLHETHDDMDGPSGINGRETVLLMNEVEGGAIGIRPRVEHGMLLCIIRYGLESSRHS